MIIDLLNPFSQLLNLYITEQLMSLEYERSALVICQYMIKEIYTHNNNKHVEMEEISYHQMKNQEDILQVYISRGNEITYEQTVR